MLRHCNRSNPTHTHRAELKFAMDFAPLKLLVFLALFNLVAVISEESHEPLNPSAIESASYGTGSFKSTGSRLSDDISSDILSPDGFSSDTLSSDGFSSGSPSSDTTPEEPVPPSESALASLGPLLALLQPIIGGILNGPGSDPGVAAYPPLLKPFFSPLPILPGFGVVPATLAAQASDLVASAAASARGLFANAARENAARSQANYGHILAAINELNMPADDVESRK